MLIRGGRVDSTVALALDPEAGPCPSISIVFSEPGDSLFRWRVEVWTRFPESTSLLGVFQTIPPASVHPNNRVVALAYAPGAVGWMLKCGAVPLTFEGAPPVTDAKADVWISRAECCGALQLPGVVPVQSEGVGEPIFEVVTRQQKLFSAGSTLIAKANSFRRRLSIVNAINGGAGGKVAIGPSISLDMDSGRLLLAGQTFETVWRGTVYGIGSAAGPEAYDGVSIWEEND